MKTNFLLLSIVSLFGWQAMAKPLPKPLVKRNHAQHQTLGFSKKATQHLPQLVVGQWWEASDWSIYRDSTHFVYNSQGQTIELNTAYSKTQNSYDAQGRVTQSITLQWDDVLERWDSVHQNITTYDAKGNDSTYTELYYENNAWVISYGYRNTNTYNNQNQLTEQISEQLYPDSSYGYNSQSFFTYPTQGGPSEAEFLNWDDSAQTFMRSYKVSNIVWHQWNGNLDMSLLTSMNVEVWIDSTYLLVAREKYTYDSHNNETEYWTEAFDGTNWTKTDGNKSLITYNSNGAMTEKIEQDFDQDSGYYINRRKEMYSDFVTYTAIKTIAANNQEVSVYPNPASSTVTIELHNSAAAETIAIYNLTGTKVLQANLPENQNQVDVSVLPKGLYFYKLQSGATGKLMIN